MLNSIKQLADYESKFPFLLLLIAFLLQAHYKFSNPIFGTDNVWQIASAKSMIEGHGIAIAYPSENDLADVHYRKLNKRAPGYVIFIAPLLLITNYNIVISEFILNVMGFLIFLIAWYKILILLKPYFKPGFYFFLFFFWAFAVSPFREVNVTDNLSLAFLTLSIYLMLSIIYGKYSQSRIWGLTVLMSVFMYLCSFFKYSFYGLSFSIPAFLLLYSILCDRKLLKYAVFSLMLVGLVVALQFFNMSDVAANNNGVDQIAGFYNRSGRDYLSLEYLFPLYQIVINSFFSNWVITRLFGFDGLGQDVSLELNLFLFCIAIIILMFLAYGVFKIFVSWQSQGNVGFLKKISQVLNEPLFTFITSLFFIVGINVGMMAYLTMRFASGYAYNPRYFVPTMVVIQILFFIVLFYARYEFKAPYKWFMRGVLFFSLLFNVAHWGYIKTKFSWFNYEANLNALYRPEGAVSDYFQLQKIVAQNEIPVVFVSNDKNKYFHPIANISGASMCPFDYLLKTKLNASRPVDVFIPVSKDKEDDAMRKFCQEHNARKLITFNHTKFDLMAIRTGPSS